MIENLIPQIETHTRKVLKEFEGYRSILAQPKTETCNWENKYKNVDSIDADLKQINDSTEEEKRGLLTKIFVAGVDFHADPYVLVKS